MSLAGFAPTAFRLGEPPTRYHISSSMYVHVSIFRGFHAFKDHPCSSVLLCVLSVSCSTFSPNLAFPKKEQRIPCKHPPILADFEEFFYPKPPAQMVRNNDETTTEQRWNNDRTPTKLRQNNDGTPVWTGPGIALWDIKREHYDRIVLSDHNTLHVSVHLRMGLF